MSLAVLADHMASKGRGPDSMLIHMSPREVQGLQALAMKHGGSLTINPDTGLPEAGFLDKLLPAIIGFAVTATTGLPAWQVGLGIGAEEAVRTGDLTKGITRGLQAYSGGTLGGNLTDVGASTIGAQTVADAAAANQATVAGTFDAGQGILPADAEALQKTVTEKMANASPYEKMAAGFDSAKASPMQYLKTNAMPLAGVIAPAVLAEMNVKNKLPTTTTKPGMIRPYSYDPYGGGYVAGNPFEATPTRAASGGIMGFDESANSPMSRRNIEGMGNTDGMFNYAHDGGGVMKMAEGGIAGYAVGGAPQIFSDEELYQQTGDWEKAAALRDAQNNALNQYNWSQQAAAQQPVASTPVAAAVPEHGFGESVHSIVTGQDYPSTGGGLAALNTAAPTYNQYTDQQIGDYLRTNPNIDIAAAIKTTNADPAAVNRYLASLDDPFRGSTDTTGGSGTLGIYNQMKALGVDPNELYSSATAFDPKYAGWTKDMIQTGYNLDKGAYALSDQLKGNVSDKNWAKFMDDNGYSINDMAQAFGLSRNEVKARYDAAKKEEKKVVTPITTVPGGTTSTVPTTYTRDGTGTGGSLESVLNLPPGVSGAGITTVNPNGTITTRPNIPGIPEGGFTGMTDVRNAYTKGGGSLGYTPYVPTSAADFNARYNTQTGGSKAAYDYLMGKSPYPLTPSTPTGEVQKPYAESVLGMPANLSKKMYLFDPATKTYKVNPDYAIPTYDAKGNKVYNVTNKDVIAQLAAKPAPADFYAWAKANNLSVEQIAAATGMPITEVQKMFTSGAPADTTASGSSGNASSESSSGTGGQATGGLAALTMARGGMAHQPFFSKSTGKFNQASPQVYADGGMSDHYNLGSYSDGGRLLRGPGDGVSDSIPATIADKRPARLADGEFVVPARIVSELGNGSTEAGARKLYAMMDRVQAARKGSIGKGKVAKNSRADKYLPA